MVSLDQFLSLVRGRLPGCPETVLMDAVRDACVEFCKRTRLFSSLVDVDVVAGEATVELYPDADTHWGILTVRRAGEPLQPISRDRYLEGKLDVTSGTPQGYYLEGDQTLVLGPVPDANETLSAWVTVRPTDTATSVASVLWSDYREPICAGARAWVRRHYGEWSEPRLEAEDRQFFERAIHNHNIRQARGGAGAPLRVRAIPF